MICGLVWNEVSPAPRAEAVIGTGSMLVLLALLFFVANLFRNCRSR
jgi:hypothetical protein